MKAKSRSLKQLFVRISAVTILLAVISFVFFFWVLPYITNKGEIVSVPDISGLPFRDAIIIATSLTAQDYNHALFSLQEPYTEGIEKISTRMIGLYPKDAENYSNLGVCHLLNGQLPEARKIRWCSATSRIRICSWATMLMRSGIIKR